MRTGSECCFVLKLLDDGAGSRGVSVVAHTTAKPVANEIAKRKGLVTRAITRKRNRWHFVPARLVAQAELSRSRFSQRIRQGGSHTHVSGRKRERMGAPYL
jgi:hypothetical protein